MTRILRIVLTIVVCLLAHPATAAESACVATTRGVASMQSGNVELINDQGQSIALQVLIADDNFERASGFQHICPEVIDRTLILFVYSSAFPGRFHMQNVYAPLDIAFFDAEGRVVSTQLMNTYTETSRPLYGPGVPFQFALEARQGFFAEHGISQAGSHLVLTQDR